jgi:endonuclease-3 related protein
MEAKAKPKYSPILDLFNRLKHHYGPSGWWPGETSFEIIVGAVLTQNTAWSNVEKALESLKTSQLFDLASMHKANIKHIATLIRPAGYYNIKSKRLKNLISAITKTSGKNLDKFLALDLAKLRQILLKVNGVGKETADSICCYAANQPIFVIDTYTKRILSRHKLIEDSCDYDEMQRLFESELPKNVQIYKDFHAYLVFIGKEFCKKTNPQCDKCPLKDW